MNTAFTLIVLGMIAVAAYAILVLARRLLADTSANPLAAAMSLLGITPADAGAAGLELALMRGESHCQGCRLRVECIGRLSKTWGSRLPLGCPNASLFHDVVRHKEATAWTRRFPEHRDLGVICLLAHGYPRQ